MKKRAVYALTVLSLIATLTVTSTVGTASAHTFNFISVDVPFDFSDGATLFPAGKYTIEPIGTNTTVGILTSSGDQKARGISQCFKAGGTVTRDTTALVFHRYGDRYFLYQVWTIGDSVGLELPRSSAERRLQREIGAKVSQGPGSLEAATVTIAAVQK